ncbi:Protein of unknown function, DUF393 [Formosa sp. Hel1_31_208]|uniref:DCC1-like thiol-disulfide oxidoreductase family protein n=1 Tax=Formosa sp. Hel1_31_208 TaxID=1798225 RepID=UPI00087D6380|nr:DCC1-like thiol-disulfide oxidoreductase family protein [Formosa sp. Hel1_31_208]SDS04932.1 Protein of unknown function, DUF393 [Formosa sp. Hel1_31_208]
MKTLEHQTLLYDEDCPLCQVYTSAFIKIGMLDNNGRKTFNHTSTDAHKFIDLNRASNEIALIDTQNNTVIYGIDSLLKIIGYRFPLVQYIGQLKPIKFLLKKLYSFISFNRKVIMPSASSLNPDSQCVPSFNTPYRIAYIIITVLTTMFTLDAFSKNLSAVSHSSLIREGSIAIGQLLFQSIIMIQLNTKIILNYLGNLMTVSLIGSLLLMPLLALNQIFNISETLNLCWFGITVLILFLEHFRRVKLLALPTYLSYTWVLYRLLILAILLIINL